MISWPTVTKLSILHSVITEFIVKYWIFRVHVIFKQLFFLHSWYIHKHSCIGCAQWKGKAAHCILSPLAEPFPCLLSKPKHGLWAAHLRRKIFLFWCILKSILGAKISCAQWHKFCGCKWPKRHNVASPHSAVYNKKTHHNIPRVHSLLLDDRWMFLLTTNFQVANYPGWRQGFFLVFVKDMKASNSPVRSHNLHFKTSKENCTESGWQRLLLWLRIE